MSLALQITRNLSTTLNVWARRSVKRSNPGLGHQITALEDAAEVIQSDPEGFGGLESDLINAHKTHHQHERELHQQREKIRQFMVKKKYFREDPMPNLLTYAEKEQIRILHSRDPEEWSVERLAESFPATVEIIRKILNANWKPMSVKRIRSHDAGSFQNWELFKRGEFNQKLPNEFREHLKKFADRRIEDINALPDPSNTFTKVQWQKPKCNEFSSIITLGTKKDVTKSPRELTQGTLQNQNDFQTRPSHNGEDETYLLSKVESKQQMRIKELNESHLNSHTMASSSFSSEDERNLSLEGRAALELENVSGTGIVKSEPVTSSALDYTDKFTTSEIVISEVDKNRYEMSAIKDRIHIPRKLWRKGATFRVDDCYYDNDGEFLYRVPGMTGR